MADKNDDMKAKMLAALEAKKNKPGAPGRKTILKRDQRFVADNAAAVHHRYSAKLVHQDLDLLASSFLQQTATF
jgi:hypothetical protein